MLIGCKECENTNEYNELDFFWDESGFGYSTKLVKCKDCGRLIVVKVIYDKGFDVNRDERFYEY